MTVVLLVIPPVTVTCEGNGEPNPMTTDSPSSFRVSWVALNLISCSVSSLSNVTLAGTPE